MSTLERLGYRLESRTVGPKLVRGIYCKGAHSQCESTEYGYICTALCTVEDARSANPYKVTLDDLIHTELEVRRRWFRVYWSATRVSVQKTFIDGRAKHGDDVYFCDTWHEGLTWTKRGARKAMDAAIEAGR